MRKILLAGVLISGLMVMGCSSTGRYNTQKGALTGAGLGALAGQAIGKNTQSTVIGTGVGALLGTIVGNSIDQEAAYEYQRQRQDYRNDDKPYYDHRYYGEYTEQKHNRHRQPPPGKWVMVPGHWEGRHWVPAHEVWRPVNPR